MGLKTVEELSRILIEAGATRVVKDLVRKYFLLVQFLYYLCS